MGNFLETTPPGQMQSTSSEGEKSGGHFSFLCAEDPQLLRRCLELRYEVYCLERGFLEPADYPERFESDEFDAQSIHFACLSRRTQDVVGTIRLVAPGATGFPLSSHCPVDIASLPANTMEISRLAVSRNFRRRADDSDYGISMSYLQPSSNEEERRRRPEIVLGLYKIMYQESKRRGVQAWLAAMEQSLARMLARLSFKFEAIGPEVDYYGPVTPYLARIDRIESVVRSSRPVLFAEFTTDDPPPARLRHSGSEYDGHAVSVWTDAACRGA